jgi:hypothetical protein
MRVTSTATTIPSVERRQLHRSRHERDEQRGAEQALPVQRVDVAPPHCDVREQVQRGPPSIATAGTVSSGSPTSPSVFFSQGQQHDSGHHRKCRYE